MHESVFVNEIFAALKKLDKDTIEKVSCVNVRLSPLSHVSKEGLLGTYAELAKGSVFEKIRLNVEPLILFLHCSRCNDNLRVTAPVFKCPRCGSENIKLNFDKEFMVESAYGEDEVARCDHCGYAANL